VSGLLEFCIASYGLTTLLCYSRIFNLIRPSYYFFHCPMCVGFWVGILFTLISPLTDIFNINFNFYNLLISGCISSGVSYFFGMIINDEGVKISLQGGNKNVIK